MILKIIMFKGKGCPDCGRMASVYNELSEEFKNTVEFEDLDISENISVAVDYGVMSIPTLLVLSGGKELKRFSGVVSASDIRKFIKEKME